jgi:hypothetical protein
MTLAKRLVQPIHTETGRIAAGASVTIDTPIPNDCAARIEADVLLVGQSGGRPDKVAALPAECDIKNIAGTTTFVTASAGSANPQNSNSAGVVAARAVGDELVGGGGASSAVWTIIPGGTLRLTITNGDAAEACEYDVAIFVHHVAFSFTPADLPLSAWYRADLGLTTTGSGLNSVQQWDEIAISPHDATKDLVQAVPAKQPTLIRQDPDYNNRATIQFDDAALQYMASAAWSAAQAQPFTIFVVGEGAAPPLNQAWFSAQGSGTHFLQAAAFYRFNAGAALDDANVPTAQPHVFGLVGNGVTSLIYDTAVTPVASGAAGAGGITDLVTGIFYDLLSDALRGKIAEIVVVNKAMSAGEVASLLNYFSARYGIAIGP